LHLVMEQQIPSSTPRPAESEAVHPRPKTPLGSSEPTLRFPRPQGNRKLAYWISSSDPDIMQPTTYTEDAGLGDSTYDIINGTDDESQDGFATESAYSVDYARTDDIHSLAGTENTHDDDGEEKYATDSESESEAGGASGADGANNQSATSIQYAEESLRCPSVHASVSSNDFDRPAEMGTPLARSIEFREAEGPVYLKKISVKHAIRSFNEEESAAIAKNLNISDPPKRLIGTIRQTMSQNCLSTREPLRILYVGSLAAKHDIIYKISSALMASASASRSGSNSDDGIYNVVPISSVGSLKVPEVELMKTSECQIKVEVCLSAKETIYEGEHFPGDTVYSITVDSDRTYSSAFCPSGSVIEPKWALPHIAVFYITENDDDNTGKSRNAAWEFMTRHGVPSVFISNSQSFETAPIGPWSKFVDQHAVHLCLESRDSSRAIPHERLPIDLTSFLNIDARQMNRNLAYLTGLHKSRDKPVASQGYLGISDMMSQSRKFVRNTRAEITNMTREENLRRSLPLFGFVVCCIMASIFGLPHLTGNRARTISPAPLTPSCALSSSKTSTTAVSVSTSTITINLTSTKTVEVPQAKSSASSLVAMDIAGLLSDLGYDSTKSTVCAAEVRGTNEILIKIPLSTKTSWLAKDSIAIDVRRGEQTIKAKFSSVDEGIIIEISKKEAYGVLSVSVVTSRRPKVNETFAIDFGKSILESGLDLGKIFVQDILDKISSSAEDAYQRVEESAPSMDTLYEQAVIASDLVVSHISAAGNAFKSFSTRVGADATQHVKNSLSSEAITKRVKNIREEAERQLQNAGTLQETIDLSLLQAQIQSKLWWLKLQDKMEEHDRYQKKAEAFMAKRTAEAVKSRQEKLDKIKKDIRARRKKERLEARCQFGFSLWKKQCKELA
jgi:hypothetical protein